MKYAVVLLAFGCSQAQSEMTPAAPMDLATPPDLARRSNVDAGTLGEVMPQVVQLQADSVLQNPTVVAVTWDNDSKRADIEAFVAQYAASSSWATQTAEYGVGPLTVGTPRHIAGNAPTAPTGNDVEALLKQNLGSSWDAPSASTVYGFFFPVGSILDDGTGSKCCTDMDGYHYDVTVNNVDVAYFIACQCPGFDGPNITDLQQLTTVASHEIVESVTDPLQSGFAESDDAHAVWTYVTDGEVADLCQDVDTTYWQPSDMTYMVQRVWSNQAAAGGHDPCVGDPTQPYYQTVPEQPDAVTVDFGYGPWDTKALHLAVGDSGTIHLHVYGDAGAGPFMVSVQDYLEWYGYQAVLQLPSTAPMMPTMMMAAVGDELDVPVTFTKKDPSIKTGASFVVTTTPVSGGPSTYYYGLIAN